MYSPKIVGNDLSESLNLKGGERALNKAIYQARSIKGITHHSDREIQYYSNLYTQILKIKKNISKTKNHCYQNTMAERVKCKLKMNFILTRPLLTWDMPEKKKKGN
jgi:putative transposase